MRRAIIVGCRGQDGRLLWEQLLDQGFALVGLSRQGVQQARCDWRDPVDIADAESVRRLLRDFAPEQIYYLAAAHHSSQDRKPDETTLWRASWDVHVAGFQNFLDASLQCAPRARLFYASSSRVFGEAPASPQDEDTPLRPSCVYGVTKAAGMMLARYYRHAHGLGVSCGILYNHESPLRAAQFVSQRVVDGLVALKTGRSDQLRLGSLDARVDWGYAADYTRAMQLIAQAGQAGDFVVASGRTHSVRDMVAIAAEALEIDWQGRVVEDDEILRRPPQQLCGNAARLRAATGWQPEVSFEEMVRIMALAALARNARGDEPDAADLMRAYRARARS